MTAVLSPQPARARSAVLATGRIKLAPTTPASAGTRFSLFPEQDLLNPLLVPRERARHTRMSTLAHGLAAACLDDLGDAVPRNRVGVVTASVYGGAEEANATREAFRSGGLPGVDPVQFSKATHSYLANVLSIGFGLRGPVSSLVGRRSATREAMWFAASMVEEGLADAMLVVAYDELGACARRHLDASAPAGVRFGEGCVVLALASHSLPAALHADARIWRDAVDDAPSGDVDRLAVNAALRWLETADGRQAALAQVSDAPSLGVAA